MSGCLIQMANGVGGQLLHGDEINGQFQQTISPNDIVNKSYKNQLS